MKRLLSKTTLLIVFLTPLLVLGTNPKWKGKYTKEKKINKEYDVSADALLKINNSYGNIYVTSWNQNRVVIEVHIKTNGNNEDRVQKKLDQIDVSFDASRSMVSAKTTFEKRTWSWSWGKKNSVSMQINYTIKVPVSNSVDLSNDYGGINLDNIDGHAKINCDYGRIDIGRLNAENNNLNFDYTKNSTIDYVKSAKITADYSGYDIAEAGDLYINADYTTSKVKKANNVEYSCDYGSLTIDNARNIKGDGDYLTAKFGKVHGNVDMNADYGSIKIYEMAQDAGNIKIRSDYAGIKIGYNSGYSFNFELDLEYAGLKGTDDFEFDVKRKSSHKKYYKGRYGSSARNTVSITSDYGGLTFSKTN